jgi:polar amino acid transport system substrate-binding protein
MNTFLPKTLFLLGLVCLAAACNRRDDNALVVGMEMSYPPFEMRNTANQPDGISVRMAEDLAACLDRPLRLEDMGFDGLIPALQTGKIDLIIASMTRTPERAEAIDFSDGYVTNGLCMLVGKNSRIENADGLGKHAERVAVKIGTTGHIWAREHLEGIELVVLDEASTCALEVAQGKADAFIYDQISIYKQWKIHAETTRPVLDPIRKETWAIGIRKGENELTAQVNAWLAEFRAAGKFNALAEEFMAEEKQTFAEMGVPFLFH